MLKRVLNTDADRHRKTEEFPVGMVMGWHSATPPSNLWLLCNGQEAPIGSHFRLYNLITANGTVFPYGANTDGNGGVGSTHFRLPDMQDRFLMSPTPALNNPGTAYVASTGGSNTHQHTFTTSNSAGSLSDIGNTHNHTYNAGSFSNTGSHNHGTGYEQDVAGNNTNITNVKRAASGSIGAALQAHGHSSSYTTGASGAHNHNSMWWVDFNNLDYNTTDHTWLGSEHQHTVPWTGDSLTPVAASHEPLNIRTHFVVYSGGN